MITGINNGSLKEIMDQSLVDLKAASKYLTAKLNNGSKLSVIMANNRGFRIALDYTRNVTVGYMDPAGGNLTTTTAPALDNMTANLQYIQFGQEISNLQLANSAPGMHVGPTDKALQATKLLERRAEMEEYYFCRGDGYQTIGDITTSVATTINVEGVMTLAGTRDGLGAYLLGVGQKVRVYSSVYAFKSSGSITSKSSNTVVGYTPTVITTTGLLDGDLVFPESDSTTPTTTGIKGLPYLNKTSGNYFDKALANVPALKAVIDSTTTTFTRTAMEALYRNSQLRAGRNPNQRAVCGLSQLSNYYAQFYAQNSAQVHVVGNERAGIDVGGSKTMDDYTFWGQPIDAYPFIHPKNWWNLDYSTYSRLTLKEAGAMLTPAGNFVQKITGGVYANAQQSWDDDYIEYLSDQPFKNSGFTALTFSGLPGQLQTSNYTGYGS